MSKYRFSLRNKEKLIKSFDEKYYNLLISSLTNYFNTHIEIIEYEYPSEKYKIIHVNNAQPNTDSIFEFYIISKVFNVYNLAYKSAIG